MNSLSIITATYNSVVTLPACVQSIRTQSVPVEHLFIDGQSDDGTVELIKSYTDDSAHQTDWVSEPDDGIYDAMNKGIRLASGNIIGILNSDDRYADPKILAQVLKVFENPEVDACYGDLVYVDASAEAERVTRYWKAGTFRPSQMYRGWMPPHPTFFVRRSVYERFGTFRTDLASAADYELMLRVLLKQGVGVAYIPQVLVRMGVGGVSTASFSNRLLAHRMDHQAWKVNDLKPYPWTLPLKPLRKMTQWLQRPPTMG